MSRNRIQVWLLLASVSFILMSSTAIAGVIDYWRFEEGAGTFAADQTGLANGTAGDWINSVPVSVVPQTGQSDAYSIHGAGTFTPSSTAAYGSNFTVELYFNLDSLPNSHINNEYTFLQFLDADSTLILSIGQAGISNPYKFSLDELDSTGSTFSHIESDASSVTYGQWFHLALVRNGGALSFYLDGA